MEDWQVVGKRSSASKVFGTKKDAENGFSGSEDKVTVEKIAAIAEKAENKVQAVVGASWFPFLSQSQLSFEDLIGVLDVVQHVVNETKASTELLDFLGQSLEHEEMRAALGRVLDVECYGTAHLLVMCRYIQLILVFWKEETGETARKFEKIASAFYRQFLMQAHTSADEQTHAILAESVRKFLENFETSEFEERFIDGYPSGTKAPDDFRLIPTHPLTQDIDGGLPFLRPNIIKGPYESLDDYLDIHFRLLREEYVNSLRTGIRDLRKGGFSHDLTAFNAERAKSRESEEEFGTVEFSIQSNLHKLQEFKNGVLVAVSNSGLNNFIYLCCLRSEGRLVKFVLCNPSDNFHLKIKQPCQLLLLKSAYYEAFRHTLDALRKIRQLPFQSSILQCLEDEERPRHWAKVASPSFREQVLAKNRSLMNDSQLKAFLQTLRRKVCLIQGPPGTGKTYVGLRIVETLLERKVTESPVLVVCYTNHALDQFLEGMLKFTESIVRIGGRSKSDKLAPYNFETLRNEAPRSSLPGEDFREKKEATKRIEESRNRIQEDEDLLGFIEGRTLYAKHQISKLSQEVSRLPMDVRDFLEVARLSKEALTKKDPSIEGPVTSSDPLENYKNSKMCSADIAEKVIACRMRRHRRLNRFGFERITEKLQDSKKSRQKLTLNEKWRFYATLHWRLVEDDHRFGLDKNDFIDPMHFERKCKHIAKRFVESHKRYSDLLALNTEVVNRIKADQTAALLRSKSIIGMTTTGAAIRRDLLHSLKCEIIVVEEAAEILEAHLVAILPKKIQQMILIGDHKQLSPVINNYTLERNFNLGVSLFERLVNNGIPYVTLNVQHRMKDTFLKLLVPHIYENITSAPTVFNLESIRGMAKDLQFLTHTCPEKQSGSDSASKLNPYEAHMVNALLEHLHHQGYKSGQIVILCAYSGQQQSVYDLVRRTFAEVRVSTIDDYQGEESDIVLVSFVRCNSQNEIGFLAKPNRVCVALSRARRGLFCFGDFAAYAKRSPLWSGILRTLTQLGSVKPYLELKCSKHGFLAQARQPKDFAELMPRGRCQKTCDAVLNCCHTCPAPCHLDDPHPVCRKECLYVHPNCGHPCRKRCYQDHGRCEDIVPKSLACGHTGEGECHIPESRVQCAEPCQKILECGHRCGNLCSLPCTQNCMFKVEITRDCGHDASVACCRRGEEKSQELCKVRVDVVLNCGHSNTVQCHRTLDMETLTSKCVATVPNVDLPCGHSENMLCRDFQNLDFYNCSVFVDVKLLCGHSARLLCFKSRDDAVISLATLECLQAIKTVGSCGHEVQVLCMHSENAAQYCLASVVVALTCGHPRRAACNQARDEVELQRMLFDCEEIVFVEAPCSHLVKVPCRERYDEALLWSLCKVIVDKTCPNGHALAVVCPSSRSRDYVANLCTVGKTLELSCGHRALVRCSEKRTRKQIADSCEQRVENILDCDHVVEQVCKGTRGNLRVSCHQKCDFVHRCGHTCTGNCKSCKRGRNHQPCRQKCNKTHPCGHACTGKCGRPCVPCQAECLRECAHGKCEKKCGEPCFSRKQGCRRQGVPHCPHRWCSAKTCWECECEPCDRKCTKKHDKCEHICEGMCGEPCVPCFKCKPKRLTRTFGTAKLSGRFLEVPGCKDLVDAEIMDQVMSTWRCGIPRCINCDREIPLWRRYNKVYNRMYQTPIPADAKAKNAKRLREEFLLRVEESRAEFSKTELREECRDVEMVRHYACQILSDLRERLRHPKSEDVRFGEQVYQFLLSLLEVHKDCLEKMKCLKDAELVREKTFMLRRDIFEDLSRMVDPEQDSESLWTASVLEDISTDAVRLKCLAVLPQLPIESQVQLLDLVLDQRRFVPTAANALLKRSNSGLKVTPFDDI